MPYFALHERDYDRIGLVVDARMHLRRRERYDVQLEVSNFAKSVFAVASLRACPARFRESHSRGQPWQLLSRVPVAKRWNRKLALRKLGTYLSAAIPRSS